MRKGAVSPTPKSGLWIRTRYVQRGPNMEQLTQAVGVEAIPNNEEITIFSPTLITTYKRSVVGERIFTLYEHTDEVAV